MTKNIAELPLEELDQALDEMWSGDRCVLIAANEGIWVRCVRGEWLIRAAGYVGVPPQRLVLAACACARDVLQFVPAGERRSLRAIEFAEAWARGEDVTKEQLRVAADAAYATASAASYDADADADAYAYAYAAAADVAYAACYAACFATAAVHAASAAAYAAASAAAASAAAYSADLPPTEAWQGMADAVRSVIAYSEIQRLKGFSEIKGFGDPGAEK